MKVDVIIPVYGPDEKLISLLDALRKQTLLPEKVLLVNTDEALFEKRTSELGVSVTDLAQGFPSFEIFHIERSEFDHGGTRRQAVKHTSSEVFVMMTQDAVPRGEHMLESLVWPLEESKSGYGRVAVSYGRQLPGKDSSLLEQFSRRFNYPAESVTKTSRSIPTMGIKTYFCSDVCAAYRRDIYEKLGGFVERTIFNEDMLYAATAIEAGYSVHYEASACVIHSHDYTNMQQLRRNFDLGVSQSQHPEVFSGVSSESEGKRLVGEATKYLMKKGRLHLLPGFYLQCASKYLGYLLGKRYRRLPRKWILKLTANPVYWEAAD